MSLRVFTAPMRYRGLDKLDVTRKSGGAAGHPFAPSWKILGPAIAANREARQARDAAAQGSLFSPRSGDPAIVIQSRAWTVYVPAFLNEMAQSRMANREAWQALLARERVVLCCYCPSRERCHRGLLAVLLAELGAVDEGEVGLA